ncbi:MAG: hypothetical protein RLZZ312_1919 [Bacteroidota bacterium]|jgi:hypothetical protein
MKSLQNILSILKSKSNKFLFAGFLLLSQIGFAQVQFETKVDRTKLGLNERLRVDFTMNVDGDNFVTPNFEGFKVIAGPFQQVSQSWINGRGTFTKSYGYILLPAQKGVLTIKTASIEYNGQVYRTAPVKINVTNAIQIAKDPSEMPSPSADNDLHLVADVSKTNPYINEPITVVYKLYFSNNIGITNSQELDKPKYNDFWSQNIEIKKLEVQPTVYKGENYRVVILKKVVLYPQKSGKLTIEPLSLDLDLQIPTGRRNIFGEQQIAEANKKVSAGAKIISVKALPEAGKPLDFTGAVGSFSFSATPTRTTLKHGESLDLVVKVSGKGNLKLFDLPKPVVPSALEMYDAVRTEDVSTTLAGTSGQFSDKYVIIPQFKGEYPVKPMSFSYFDLGSQSYKTIMSPEIMIKVLDGPISTTSAVATTNDGNKKAIAATDQFQYIKLKTNLTSIKQKDFLGSNMFFSLVGLPFLFIPALILFRRRRESSEKDVFGNRIKMNNRLAKKYLSEAKKQLGNKEQFYVALEKAMHNFLKAKLFIETSEMSKERISEILLNKNANPSSVQDFIDLTENCEIARYAPSSETAIQNDFDKAVAIISELERQLK